MKEKPDEILVWEKDGNHKWCDLNNEVFQAILHSNTGMLHFPKCTLYLQKYPVREHASDILNELEMLILTCQERGVPIRKEAYNIVNLIDEEFIRSLRWKKM